MWMCVKATYTDRAKTSQEVYRRANGVDTNAPNYRRKVHPLSEVLYEKG